MEAADFLPVYEFAEVHTLAVRAAPESVFRAIRETTPAEMPLLRLLFGLRARPARLAGRARPGLPRTRPLLAQMLAARGTALLAEEPGRALVVGVIGRFWELRGDAAPTIAGVPEFLAFDRPDYAKAVMDFRLAEGADGGVTVGTRTRIHIADPAARRQFARYWRLIRPWSALTRRMRLRAIKRRAERRLPAGPA